MSLQQKVSASNTKIHITHQYENLLIFMTFLGLKYDIYQLHRLHSIKWQDDMNYELEGSKRI